MRGRHDVFAVFGRPQLLVAISPNALIPPGVETFSGGNITYALGIDCAEAAAKQQSRPLEIYMRAGSNISGPGRCLRRYAIMSLAARRGLGVGEGSHLQGRR